MEDWLLHHWWLLAGVAYAGGFLLVAFWEIAAPRRDWTVSSVTRWSNNFGVFVVGSSLVYFVVPGLSIGFALLVNTRGWGLFNHLGFTGPWAIAAGLLVLDFMQYLEHRTVHRVPLLWRIHRMHHADLDYDITTGLRFHPLEGVFATLWRMAPVAVLGLPVAAVCLSELLLVLINYFVHGNVRMPLPLDRRLRRVIVTPDLHRVHHSTERCENDSNFGSVLTVWDRVFGTYVAQPAAGHLGMTIGLNEFRAPRHMWLPWMLANPFLRTPRSVPGAAPPALSLDDA